jgi:signal transduction histidine kinase
MAEFHPDLCYICNRKKNNGSYNRAVLRDLMKQDRKTKKQLIDDLEVLRRRLKDFEDSEIRHRQAEEAMREQEQSLQAILQGSPISAFVIGKDHRILYWNRALEELSNIRAREVIGTNQHWRAFYSRERPCMADLIVDGNLGTLPKWYRGKYRKSDLLEEAFEATDFFPDLGKEGRWLRFTAAAIRNSAGDLVGAIETLEDITERKRAEEELKDSEQRLWSVIQGSPIPTFVIGKDRRVIYWNRALEELSRIPAADVIGTTEHWRAFYGKERPCMADLIVDEALETVPDWYSGKDSRSDLFEEAFEATDFFPDLGEEGRWLRFTAAAIRNSAGDLVGAIETLEDITERKRAEEELTRIGKLESLGLFADGVAQDFDGLLSAMLRSIFLAKLSVPEGDRELEEILSTAEKAGLQAKELAHWLITFAKGGYPLRQVAPIARLVKEAVNSILSGSDIECRFSIADDLWPSEVDEGQVRMAVQNIVLNARDAMPRKGTIHIAAGNETIGKKSRIPLAEGHYLKLSIRDQGIGISKENLPRVFDPYFTTKDAKGRKGIGLGLSVCQSIVKNHKGLITLESEVGRGTTVHVYLPAAEPPASDRPGD